MSVNIFWSLLLSCTGYFTKLGKTLCLLLLLVLSDLRGGKIFLNLFNPGDLHDHSINEGSLLAVYAMKKWATRNKVSTFGIVGQGTVCNPHNTCIKEHSVSF
jgi:hypothetical protein